MLLSTQGPALEFQQALHNSEAVARCFNCSVSTSSISLTIYCSIHLSSSDRIAIENQKDISLVQMKSGLNIESSSSMSLVDDPVVLYILVPDLPKRALVEVKPMLYTGENIKAPTGVIKQDLCTRQTYWGFHHKSWHTNCLQKCVISGRLCSAVVSVTLEIAAKVQHERNKPDDDSECRPNTEKEIERLANFCIYILDGVLLENDFSWADVMNLRIYFTSSLVTSHATLSAIFTNVFNEFCEMSTRMDVRPVFNLVPVLGAGKSATSMDDILTCEMFATKF